MSRYKQHKPYYITLIAMLLFVAIYFYLRHFDPSDASEIIVTILAIVAGVAFWLEYHHNSKVNEAQFVMELNNQFLTDKKMARVEHKLEQFYAKVKDGAPESVLNEAVKEMKAYFDIESTKRQDLVNYLVHLEGVATMVNTGVLKIQTISDLMAYRYFIAVNNPVVQELELNQYREYYKGIDQLYNSWRKIVKTMPLEENAWKKEENRHRGRG